MRVTGGQLTRELEPSERSSGVLYGAVAICLLLGGLWFILYVLIERTSPGSFTGLVQPGDWTHLLYYSFVTLTTLGFGDITPLTLRAQHLTVAEAIAGVLYLPIVISRCGPV